jgi:hypothetical protein
VLLPLLSPRPNELLLALYPSFLCPLLWTVFTDDFIPLEEDRLFEAERAAPEDLEDELLDLTAPEDLEDELLDLTAPEDLEDELLDLTAPEDLEDDWLGFAELDFDLEFPDLTEFDFLLFDDLVWLFFKELVFFEPLLLLATDLVDEDFFTLLDLFFDEERLDTCELLALLLFSSLDDLELCGYAVNPASRIRVKMISFFIAVVISVTSTSFLQIIGQNFSFQKHMLNE